MIWIWKIECEVSSKTTINGLTEKWGVLLNKIKRRQFVKMTIEEMKHPSIMANKYQLYFKRNNNGDAWLPYRKLFQARYLFSWGCHTGFASFIPPRNFNEKMQQYTLLDSTFEGKFFSLTFRHSSLSLFLRVHILEDVMGGWLDNTQQWTVLIYTVNRKNM